MAQGTQAQSFQAITDSGLSGLHACALKGDVQGVEHLLGEGTDVNQTITLVNKNRQEVLGVTPLFLAAQQGHEHIVKLLLEEGADPSLQCTVPTSKQSFGPVDIAMTNLHLKVWRTLKNYQRPSTKNSWPWSKQSNRSSKYIVAEQIIATSN